MKSIEFGRINEIYRRNEIIYQVELMTGKSSWLFATKKDALDYFREHAKAFFLTTDFAPLDVEFIEISGGKHYMVFTKSKNGKIVVTEESPFDYTRIRAHKYKEMSRRKIINERDYNYSDVLRKSINWSRYYMFFLITLTLLTSAIMSTLSFLASDVVDIPSKYIVVFRNDVAKWLIVVSSILSFLVFMIISFRLLQSWKLLYSNRGDYHDVDWRKKYNIRMRIIIYIFVVGAVALAGTTFWFIDEKNSFDTIGKKISISVAFGTSILALIISIYTFTTSTYWKNRTLKRLFTYKEILEFKRWKSGKRNQIRNKSNKEAFVYKAAIAKRLTQNEINFTTNILLDTPKARLKKVRINEINEVRLLRNNYFVLLDEKLELPV